MALPELRTTTVNGLTLAWREAGEGAPLVLLHGIGSGSLGWGAQFEAFADRYRVVAWDAPGYGGSDDLPVETPAPADYAEALAGLLDALGIEAANLCGNSLGALFIGAFVRRYPERVLSMILSDAAAGHARLSEAERAEKLQARISSIETLGPAGMAEQRSGNLLSPSASEPVRAAVREVMSRVRPHGYGQAAHALSRGDLLSDLEGCETPALVLCGEDDKVTPPEGNRAAAAALKDSRFALLEKVGHLPYVEAPDRFNRLVGDFLAEREKAGGMTDTATTTTASAAEDNDRYIVPGLMRGLALLEAFSTEHQTLSLAELSKAVGLPRSSVFRLAYTLTELGFLIRDDAAKTYRLGARVLGLGFTYLASQELIEVARPRLEALSDRTHCSAHLGVLEGTEIVYLARYAVDSAMTSGIRVGARLPAHATSIGRAILSQLPHDEVRALFREATMTAFTEQTATTIEALLQQTIKDAARGFALSHSAFESGIASVAAPVFGPEGKVVAAINVTTPESAIATGDLEGRIAEAVLGTAEEISSWLGYPGRKRTA